MRSDADDRAGSAGLATVRAHPDDSVTNANLRAIAVFMNDAPNYCRQ
jgi:hypothetical protein